MPVWWIDNRAVGQSIVNSCGRFLIHWYISHNIFVGTLPFFLANSLHRHKLKLPTLQPWGLYQSTLSTRSLGHLETMWHSDVTPYSHLLGSHSSQKIFFGDQKTITLRHQHEHFGYFSKFQQLYLKSQDRCGKCHGSSLCKYSPLITPLTCFELSCVFVDTVSWLSLVTSSSSLNCLFLEQTIP